MTRNLNPADLLFLFDNVNFGDTPPPGTDPFAMLGIRSISGINNNITGAMIVDQYNNIVDTATFGNLNQTFIELISSTSALAYAPPSATPGDPGYFVMDTAPRIISNLIADATAANPATAGVDMLNPGDPVNDILPFNSLFTLFGQFFDHGLDFVAKGGNGVVAIPLLPSDPLYDPTPGAVNMMFLTRATVDGNGDTINTTAPFIEQSQTYGSHEATSFYLKEYDANGDATGDLVHGENGLATWADIKANALQWALAQAGTDDPVPTEMLNDTHIFDIPDPTMWDPTTASFMTGAGTGQSFLADIAHNANPDDGAGGFLTADADAIINPFGFGALPPLPGEYDDELLDAHYIAGDPRANENAGLSAIHQAFHDEHTRIVDQLKDWVQQQDQVDPGYAAQWTGEMFFQAAKVVNEMQYQHMVFEEFGRRMSPNIDLFSSYDVNINPNIMAEFAHAVYRLGHSMQTDTVRAANSTGVIDDNTLIDAFLNPILFAEHGGADFLKGAQMEQGAQIDEFVVDGLRNFLVGLPLDLAALNIARGRETGLGSLNQTRAELFADTGDASLAPYTSWADFGAHLLNPGSLTNFIAAYSHDAAIDAARTAGNLTLARTLADAMIAGNGADFNGTDMGFWDIDLWMGGLAEEKVPLGMLGSTFDFIFAQQMIALQDGDRFYYLGRIAGTNILDQIESHTFADIMSRSTGAMHLNGDAFGFADQLIELSSTMMTDFTKTPTELLDYVSEIIGGTSDANFIQGGAGNDSIYGEGGDDTLNGGANDDHVYGGEGDDLIFGEVGFDFLRGDAGDDEIHGGADDDGISGGVGDDLIFGNQGFDALLGNAGNDEIYGGNQDDEIIGGEGDDELHGGNGADEIIGSEGNDVIFGDSGDDRITGDDGNDLIIGGSGADRIDGGVGGFDISSYETYNDSFMSGAVSGLTINMLDPALGTGDARDDSFDNIEAVRGTKHDDTMIGDDLDNILYGGEGDDNISGGLGADTLFGGEGDDTLSGNAGVDTAVFEGTVGMINGVGDGDWDIVAAVGGNNVVHNVTGETDFVANSVELLSFDDGMFDLTQGLFVPLVGLSAAHTQTRMQNGTEVTGELEAILPVMDGTSLAGTGHFVAEIEVVDPDGSGALTFTIGGDDAAAFTIVNNGGVRELHLTGGGATSFTNFEIKPSYHVTVNVSDANGSSAVNLTLNVEDVNDNAPVITSGNRVNVDENTAVHEVLYRASSDDLDSTGETVTYSLSGADAGLFNLTNEGELRFDSSSNFENPLDANGDNIYELTIEATDGTNIAAPQNLKIHVKDVIDSINGDNTDNDLEGFSGADMIYAFDGDDDIEGKGGNDEIFGGNGSDTAHYSGALGDYSFNIIDTNGTLQVIDNRPTSPDGTDLLHDVEFFEFDGTPGTFPAAALFTNAPVVEPDPVDLGSIPEDTATGVIISVNSLVNGAFDLNGDTLTVANVTVPVGQGTITEVLPMGSGFYNYVPAADDDTDVVISYDVTDGTNFTPYSATLDLTPIQDAPVAGAAVDLGASDEDTLRVITAAELLANASDVDTGDVLTASNLVASSGSLVDNMDGTWDFTPDLNDDTGVTFTFDISDGTDTVPGSASLDLTPVNDAPVAGAAVDLGASDEDTLRVITAAELLANASDVDTGDVLTASNLVASSGSLVDNMDGTWDFTPDLNDDTGVTFTFDISDGTDTVPGSASLDLTPVNDAPVAGAAVDLGASDEDTLRVITAAELLANASDVDTGDVLTASNLVASSGSLVDNMDGTWDFTPDLNDDTGVTFTFDISDGTDTVPGSASLDLTPVNDAPVAGAAVDLGASDEDTLRVITAAELLANASDVDTSDVLTASNLVASSGSLVDNMDGTWDFTPDLNDDTGVTFTFDISDGTDTVPGSASLDLTPVNDAPVAGAAVDLGASDEDTLRVITAAELLANASDVDTGDVLTASNLVASSGSLVDNMDGTWDFTPDLNDDTGVTFTFDISDGTDTVPGSASLDLTPVNDAPVAGAAVDLGASDEDTLRVITAAELLANASDVDTGDVLTASNLVASSGSLVDNMDGTWDFTPDLNDDTGVTFTFDISDGTDTVPGSASLDFTPVNDAAIIAGDLTGSGDENSGVSVMGTATSTDVDNANNVFIAAGAATLYGTYSVSAAGAWVYTIDDANPTVDALDNGDTLMDSFNIESEDGTLETVNITINGAGGLMIGTPNIDTLTGTSEVDEIHGLESADMIFGLAGDDILNGGAGDDIIDGGDGVDTADYSGASSDLAVYLLYTGLDVGGGLGADTLLSIENLSGSSFNDRLAGDADDNVFHGGDGNDVLKGKDGNDTFYGGDGDDKIVGGSGDDYIDGGAGNDILYALSGTDTVLGGLGDDFVYGGADMDMVYGGGGDDRVRGNLGNDQLFGDAGIDQLRGGGGDDNLDGGADNDFLYGENGFDIIFGGAGNDALTGGFGGGVFDGLRDTFVYSDSASGGGGFDRIKDWEDGTDLIDLTSFGFTDFTNDVLALASNDTGGVRIDFGGIDTLFIENLTLANFDAGDVFL